MSMAQLAEQAFTEYQRLSERPKEDLAFLQPFSREFVAAAAAYDAFVAQPGSGSATAVAARIQQAFEGMKAAIDELWGKDAARANASALVDYGQADRDHARWEKQDRRYLLDLVDLLAGMQQTLWSDEPTPPPEPLESSTMIADNNPYGMTVRATIVSEADWASPTKRPDKTFADASVAPFGVAVGRADLAGTARSARFRVEATLDVEPKQTIAFTVDQAVVKGPEIRDQPLAVSSSGSRKYLVTQSTRTNAQSLPELVVVVTEEKGS